jgi:hypothetical protein
MSEDVGVVDRTVRYHRPLKSGERGGEVGHRDLWIVGERLDKEADVLGNGPELGYGDLWVEIHFVLGKQGRDRLN